MKFKMKEIKSLIKSFAFAARGIWFCIRNERNMRIHIVAACAVLLFSFAYDLTRVEYSLLILIMGLVMVCELINTAIEALVDLGTSSYDSLARIAKDVAAGAVFMCALASIGIAVAIFGNIEKLTNAIITIVTNPFYAGAFIILFIFGSLFIFKGVKNIRLPSPSFMKVNQEEKVKIYSPKKKENKNHVILSQEEDVRIYYGKKEREE